MWIYPGGTSQFTLYDDDGQTNAYRRGEYALTTLECEADRGVVTVRIGEATGRRDVVPAGRQYLLALRMAAPRAVTIGGIGELPRLEASRQSGPGWWPDARGFTHVRLSPGSPLPVTVTLAT